MKKAEELAKEYLSSKPRLSGDCAYDHAHRIFNDLARYHVTTPQVLMASLVHDIPVNTLEKYIDSDGLDLIGKYNALKNMHIDPTRPSNEAYAIQTYVNTANDLNVLVLRLFDRLDNVKTLYALDESTKVTSAKRTLSFYAPLAKFLGFGKLSTELEDTAFMHIYPDDYFNTQAYLQEIKDKAMPTLDDAVLFIKSMLKDQNIDADISFRVKGCYSTHKKLLRLGMLYDTIAARVVVDTLDECYKVEDLLHDVWDYFHEYRDDYIQSPRPSGYQSIHNVFKVTKDVFMEVQIRTKEMHEFNEYGPASHLLYKIGDKGASSHAYKKFLSYTNQNKYWFKDLNFWEVAEKSTNKAPFAKYIYAFTPKGDIIQLPNGACLIDFAYAVHTYLGDHCTGGYANNKYVPLTYIVKTGDFIKIETGKKLNANRDWLSIVKTHKARTDIRRALGISKHRQ